MSRVLLLLLVINLSQVSRNYADINKLGIYGGKNVSIETVPYMVSIFIRKTDGKKYMCGGSIIHKKFVLTAAHCLRNSIDLSLSWGYVATDNLFNKERQVIKFEKKICHKKYLPQPYFYNDICILKLTKPLKYGPKIGRVTVADEGFELKEGTLVNVTGWGDTENNDPLESLRQVTIPIVPKDFCPIADRNICAGTLGHGTCYGDSGGPLTYYNIQIGIVSHHRVGGKCSEAHGTIFTSVAIYAKWIAMVIKMNVP
ncbi:chymotrypsin-2-like [Leguminivora glycinivorella]|uniref:chymotrypsin-2-like n=1 Tax=Leguminivora glycinivorella TaxID=1035111 RepID=UPI00200FAD4A|nr:chymotrypsin-2-like [Leguminivora glycinivorella]